MAQRRGSAKGGQRQEIDGHTRAQKGAKKQGISPRSGDPLWGLMKKEKCPPRASLLAAADEGVHRNARGGRGPQFLKRHGGTEGKANIQNSLFKLQGNSQPQTSRVKMGLAAGRKGRARLWAATSTGCFRAN